jgi:hypothetical protein
MWQVGLDSSTSTIAGTRVWDRRLSVPAGSRFPAPAPPGYNAGMSDDQQRPLWPWIVVLLIGFSVVYVVSFGRACWLVAREKIPFAPTAAVYRPISRWILVPISRNKIARKCLAFGDKMTEAEMEVVLGYY